MAVITPGSENPKGPVLDMHGRPISGGVAQKSAGKVQQTFQKIFAPKIPFYRGMTRFTVNMLRSPIARSMQRHPAMWMIGIAAGTFMGHTLGQLQKTVVFKKSERPGVLSRGPGYISWAKKNGMPADNLSTQGLSLALSNLRHTSVL